VGVSDRRDVLLLFTARGLRMFGYGFLAVVLVLYLSGLGLSGAEIGVLLALTLLGDAAVSLWLTTHADRLGRRRVLLVGALLMLVAGIVFAASPVYLVLLVAATLGVISPSGNEVGPFLAVEQASLAQVVPAARRTGVFAWYQLIGILLAIVFSFVGQRVEVGPGEASSRPAGAARLGLHRSQAIIVRLSALFALDAFAGGFVLQSFIAYWFHERFGLDPGALGVLLLGTNLLAGVSALAAGWLAARFGLIRTMVFSHLPSNVLLVLVPLMPTLPLAAGVLLARFSISQMDVPTRQAYTMAVVAPDERSAAAGITGIARSLGVATSPLIAAPMFATAALMSFPFIVSGGLKIVYDLVLYRMFNSRPPDPG
jgi:predicted MFS family arabinose efflux permease